MAHSFSFSRFAKKIFFKLEKNMQERILEKFQELKKHEHISSVLKPLINFGPATHRLRVGDYRVILQRMSETDFLIVDIGHRRDVYR